MKCEKCGREIFELDVNFFDWEGADYTRRLPIQDCDPGIIVDVDANWTGYELSEEEMPDTIECPHCHQFPFNEAEIQVQDLVQVVMLKGSGASDKPEAPLPCPFCGCEYYLEEGSTYYVGDHKPGCWLVDREFLPGLVADSKADIEKWNRRW